MEQISKSVWTIPTKWRQQLLTTYSSHHETLLAIHGKTEWTTQSSSNKFWKSIELQQKSRDQEQLSAEVNGRTIWCRLQSVSTFSFPKVTVLVVSPLPSATSPPTAHTDVLNLLQSTVLLWQEQVVFCKVLYTEYVNHANQVEKTEKPADEKVKMANRVSSTSSNSSGNITSTNSL